MLSIISNGPTVTAKEFCRWLHIDPELSRKKTLPITLNGPTIAAETFAVSFTRAQNCSQILLPMILNGPIFVTEIFDDEFIWA
jgi:hypothetical protein